MTVRKAVVGVLAFAIGALLAPSAWAKGTPPEKQALPSQATGTSSVSAGPGGPTYTTGSRAGHTTVEARQGGKVVDATGPLHFNGHYAIPAVTVDGAPGGLSADGSVLTLVKQPGSKLHTNLLFLHTDPFRRPRPMDLDGRFSFDAISPDGDTIYLIQYLSPIDDTNYAVRAVDVSSTRLLPGQITDPAEEDSGEMGGLPVDRAMSAGGRWAYTLYAAPARKPFVHALDTQAGKAHCIDIPNVRDGDLAEGSVSVGPGGGLTVRDERGLTVAVVDTSTFEARAPGVPAPDAATPPPAADHGGSTNWTPIILGAVAAALAAGGGAMFLRRRRRTVAAPG